MAQSKAIAQTDLQALIQASHLSIPEASLVPLAGYLELLQQWNKVMNLVGTRTWKETFSTLIVDSIHLAGFLSQNYQTPDPICWDLGAGAGLPGIPLRMLWTSGEYWMVEAREKRALFLSTVLARHPLPQTHVFQGRAEAFMTGSRRADLVVSRAFMPWPDVLALVRSSLAPDGCVVLLLREPVVQADGWKVLATYEYKVRESDRYFCLLTPNE